MLSRSRKREKIRFHHISLDYLASVLACCPLASASGMALSFFQSALIYRNVGQSLAEKSEGDLGAINRGNAKADWMFEGKITLEDAIKLEKGNQFFKFLGLAGGLPMAVNMEHEEEEKETVEIFCRFMMPSSTKESFTGCLRRSVGFEVSMEVGTIARSLSLLFDEFGWGWHNNFEKPWNEVVCPNSPYFPDGALHVKFRVKKIGKEET